MPSTLSSSSTDENGPFLVLSSNIRWAIDGPTPGSVARSSRVAVWIFVSDGCVAGGAPSCGEVEAWILLGTMTFCPSCNLPARLRSSSDASGEGPPASSRASATLEPSGALYSPGLTTAPATWTVSLRSEAGALAFTSPLTSTGRGLERAYATRLPAQSMISRRAMAMRCGRVRDSAALTKASNLDLRYACIACSAYHKQYNHIKCKIGAWHRFYTGVRLRC